MLNQVCNLACPYCFANEFVGRSEDSLRKDKSQITEENFKTALKFAIKSREGRIGLIGGEPLLHPNFERMVELAINTPIPKVHLFTNGVFLDNYFHLFGSDKFTILINVNSPEDIGEKQYARMVNNIDYLINKMHAKRKIAIGVNIYKEDMDFSFITNLVKKYKFDKLRLAIVVPNTNESRIEDTLDYFRRMKSTTFKLFKELNELKCVPRYDCNGMPPCVTTDEEKKWLHTISETSSTCKKSNINSLHKCNPVLDVLPNLEVVRCFGMSNEMKVNLLDFNDSKQIAGYFRHEIDNLMSLVSASEECINCPHKNADLCTGGCLAFKADEFRKLKDIVRINYFGNKIVNKS